MTRDHLECAVEALEFQHRDYEVMLSRQPKTRGGKPNPMHAHLVQCMSDIAETLAAFKAELERAGS